MSKIINFEMLLCLLEGIALVFFFNHILERKFKNKIVLSSSLILYIALSYFINTSLLIIKMSVSIIAFLFLCIINYKDHILVKIGCVIYAYYIFVMSDVLIADIMSIIQKISIYNTISSSNASKVVFSLVAKLFNFILFSVSIHIFKKIKTNYKQYYWLYFDIIIGCFLCIAITFVNLYPIMTYNPNEMTLFLFLSCMFFTASYLILCLFAKLCAYLQKEQIWAVNDIKYESLKNQMDLQKKYVDETRKVRHDIKKIIHTISYFNSQKQYESLTDFLSTITIDKTPNSSTIFCGNQIIDAILNLKSFECENKNIQLKLSIAPCIKCNINSNDIILILSNLIDNAIEAVVKIPDERKTVTLKMYNYGQNLVVYSENKYIQNQRKRHFFDSDKKDSSVHGYGVKIISDLVTNNNGNISFDYDNNLFKATIILPNYSNDHSSNI